VVRNLQRPELPGYPPELPGTSGGERGGEELRVELVVCGEGEAEEKKEGEGVGDDARAAQVCRCLRSVASSAWSCS